MVLGNKFFSAFHVNYYINLTFMLNVVVNLLYFLSEVL